MKKISIPMMLAGFLLVNAKAFAGDIFAIKAYGLDRNSTGNFNLLSTNQINCNGTLTNKIFWSINQSGEAFFLYMAELTDAAKNGYSVEIISSYFDATKGSCRLDSYLIHVL